MLFQLLHSFLTYTLGLGRAAQFPVVDSSLQQAGECNPPQGADDARHCMTSSRAATELLISTPCSFLQRHASLPLSRLSQPPSSSLPSPKHFLLPVAFAWQLLLLFWSLPVLLGSLRDFLISLGMPEASPRDRCSEAMGQCLLGGGGDSVTQHGLKVLGAPPDCQEKDWGCRSRDHSTTQIKSLLPFRRVCSPPNIEQATQLKQCPF